MPEVLWYYARDDQPMGPVSASELKQLAEVGELKPDDLLWREGMDEWTTAINLRGLFGDGSGSPADVASSVVPRRAPDQSARPPAVGQSSGAQLQSLVRVTQTVLWTTCVLVVMVGVVLFTRAFLQAETPAEEAAAGAVFSTFFIAAYVLARSGEKLAQLLVAFGRPRSK